MDKGEAGCRSQGGDFQASGSVLHLRDITTILFFLCEGDRQLRQFRYSMHAVNRRERFLHMGAQILITSARKLYDYCGAHRQSPPLRFMPGICPSVLLLYYTSSGPYRAPIL